MRDDEVEALVMSMIKLRTDRDKQVTIGPSELGGCPYCLAQRMYLKLHPKNNLATLNPYWMGSWIGTAVHEHMESIEKDNNLNASHYSLKPLEDALIETKVDIFEVPGYGWIRGSIDLLLTDLRIVDWKGLPLDTKIPTPSGWTTMGELREGDEVFDGTGKPCLVTHKSEIHHNPTYEIGFDDGSSIVADEDHRWLISVGRNWEEQVLTTKEIAEHYRMGGKKQRDIRILNNGALKLPPVDLLIDPYVLGLWLGDGCSKGVSISCNSRDAESILNELVSRGYASYITQYKGNSDNMSTVVVHDKYATVGQKSILRSQLESLGVWGNKHIPPQYLRSSKEQRLELLRGLMDSDGSWNVARNNQVEMSTTQEWQAFGVAELVRSMGWTCNVWHGPKKYRFSRDASYETKNAYILTFRPDGVNPFRIRDYPVETLSRRHRSLRRIVTSIKLTESVIPTQCIGVDSVEETYLCTDRMIVTHNTSRRDYIQKYKQEGVPKTYPVQQTMYIHGLRENYGLDITDYTLAFIARDGTGDRDIWFYHGKYDKQLALETIDKINYLWEYVSTGLDLEEIESDEDCFRCSMITHRV